MANAVGLLHPREPELALWAAGMAGRHARLPSLAPHVRRAAKQELCIHAAWVDRLFVTWHMPKSQWPFRYGIEAPVAQSWARPVDRAAAAFAARSAASGNGRGCRRQWLGRLSADSTHSFTRQARKSYGPVIALHCISLNWKFRLCLGGCS